MRGSGRVRQAWITAVAVAVSAGLLAGCSGGTPSGAGKATSPRPAASQPASAGAKAPTVLGPAAATTGTVTVPKYVKAGASLALSASGLPKGQPLAVVWERVSGAWNVHGATFVGESYKNSVQTLSTVTTSATGTVQAQVPVPQGFGYHHAVGLRDAAGQIVAQSVTTVIPVATLAKASAAQGGSFDFTIAGLGYSLYSAEYQVLYDSRLTGEVSAVSTAGTAHFAVPAHGVGPHVITLVAGVVEGPYLNWQQSPLPWMPTFTFPVTVLSGQDAASSESNAPRVAPARGSHLTADPGVISSGSPFVVQGSGLPAGAQLTLNWATATGNNIIAGRSAEIAKLATVRTDAGGSFSIRVDPAPGVGGPPHTLTATLDGKTVGSVPVRVVPTLLSPATVTAKAGQMITVRLSGTGWTDYDNIYAVDYDNGFVGIACGFNTGGAMDIQFVVTGAPGVHYLDLYPTIYKGEQPLPNFYGLPQLTYAQDHPGDNEPAFHIRVRVEG